MGQGHYFCYQAEKKAIEFRRNSAEDLADLTDLFMSTHGIARSSAHPAHDITPLIEQLEERLLRKALSEGAKAALIGSFTLHHHFFAGMKAESPSCATIFQGRRTRAEFYKQVAAQAARDMILCALKTINEHAWTDGEPDPRMAVSLLVDCERNLRRAVFSKANFVIPDPEHDKIPTSGLVPV